MCFSLQYRKAYFWKMEHLFWRRCQMIISENNKPPFEEFKALMRYTDNILNESAIGKEDYYMRQNGRLQPLFKKRRRYSSGILGVWHQSHHPWLLYSFSKLTLHSGWCSGNTLWQYLSSLRYKLSRPAFLYFSRATGRKSRTIWTM